MITLGSACSVCVCVCVCVCVYVCVCVDAGGGRQCSLMQVNRTHRGA